MGNTSSIPHFSYFRWRQSLTPNLLAPLCGVALELALLFYPGHSRPQRRRENHIAAQDTEPADNGGQPGFRTRHEFDQRHQGGEQGKQLDDPPADGQLSRVHSGYFE